MPSYELPRSRDWVCPRCNRSNLECLPDPDPAQPNDAGTLSVSEAKTSSEAEVVSTPPDSEVVPPQPPKSEPSVSEPEANTAGTDGTSQSESDDTTSVDKTTLTSVVASSHSSESSAPTQNISNVHGARQPVPVSFRPSHTARPPMLLDTAICVLLALVFALLCRRVF